VDFLAVVDFAEIHTEHDDEEFEKTHRFKEPNAHQWVIVASPFYM